MKFANVRGRSQIIVNGRGIDIATASAGRFGPDPMELFARWDEVTAWAKDADLPDGADYTPRDCEAPSPRPRQVFAVASNYSNGEAVADTYGELPVVFTKFPSSIAGPYADLPLPTATVDWEVELVAIIGRETHLASTADAWDAIAGLTVGQDFSERTLQKGGVVKQFALGKSYPHFGPTGPVMVTPDEFGDRDGIALQCFVNGELMQDGRTSSMIFPVAELIVRLSQICRLYPGDLIFTGTPGGAGMALNPPRYLKPGDDVLSRIEGIGDIRSTCVAAEGQE